MKAAWYAEALYGALKEAKNEAEGERIFARFRKVVAVRGHQQLLGTIPRELDKIIAREQEHKESVLVIADKKDQSKWEHAYDHYKKEGVIPKDSKQRLFVDESIVGGFQIRTKDTLIDGSYKRSLIEFYRSIINQK